MSSTRQVTLDLLAASIPLRPDAEQIRKHIAAPGLDWDDALYLADGHGITPLLYQLWRKLNLLSFVPPAARTRMEQAYADNATRNADARRELAEITRMMDEARVDTIALKGLPLLAELYEDPAERVLYDFDLLARNVNEAQRGFETLLAAGFTRVPTKAGALVNKHLPSVWRLNGFVRRGYLFDPWQPRPVELHLTLWDTEWRGLDVRALDDLWTRRRDLDFDGMRVRVLAPEDALLHLCVHLATHLVEREARLGQVIDVARMLARRGSDLDWTRILDAGDRAHVTRFVYLALRAAHQLTGAPLPASKTMEALRARTPRRLREWSEQHGAADLIGMDYRQPDLSQAYALTFAATQSVGEKMGVLRFALLPPRTSLQEQYGAGHWWLYARHISARGREYLRAARRTERRDSNLEIG